MTPQTQKAWREDAFIQAEDAGLKGIPEPEQIPEDEDPADETAASKAKKWSAIPQTLKSAKQWVCWEFRRKKDKNGKDVLTKVPISPHDFANTSAPEAAWSLEECEQAVKQAAEKGREIGLGLSLKNGIVGIDYDHVLDEKGRLKPEHAALMDEIRALNSYTEVSPSGTGLHVMVQCLKLPDPEPDGEDYTKGRKTKRGEIYPEKHFLTVTGMLWADSPSRDVNIISSELYRRVYDRIAGTPQQKKAPVATSQPPQAEPAGGRPVEKADGEIPDEKVISLIQTEKDTKWADLWEGRWEGHEYSSQSEADEGLMWKLAFYTRKNREQMRRLFLQSGLGKRDKAQRPDYIERLIEKACKFVTNAEPTEEEKKQYIEYRKRWVDALLIVHPPSPPKPQYDDEEHKQKRPPIATIRPVARAVSMRGEYPFTDEERQDMRNLHFKLGNHHYVISQINRYVCEQVAKGRNWTEEGVETVWNHFVGKAADKKKKETPDEKPADGNSDTAAKEVDEIQEPDSEEVITLEEEGEDELVNGDIGEISVNQAVEDVKGCIKRIRTVCNHEIFRYGEEKNPPWKRHEFIREIKTSKYTPDDIGNGRRYIAECKGWIITDTQGYETTSTSRMVEFYAWIDGTHWDKKQGRELAQKAADWVGESAKEEYFVKAAETPSWTESEEGKNHRKNANNRLRSHAGITAMMKQAQTYMLEDIEKKTDYSLIACKNGVIDGRNREFIPKSQCERLKLRYPTTYIDCIYTQGARSEKWMEHLQTVMTDNTTEEEFVTEEKRDQLVAYLLRVLGYLLHSGNPERKIMFWHGEGANGKSATMNVIKGVLGDEAAEAALTHLYATDEDKPTPTIADGLPRRLMILNEAEGGGGRLASSAIKELTGERESKIWRRMRENNRNTRINCFPIAICNKMPEFEGGAIDLALSDRIIAIPFNHRFEPAAQKKGIEEDILTEKDAIFSMMVDEYFAYCEKGLISAPDCAQIATKALKYGECYHFIIGCLERTDDITEAMTHKQIANAYQTYLREHGLEIPLNRDNDLVKSEKNKLFGCLRDLNYKTKPRKMGGERGFMVRQKVTPPAGGHNILM